MPTIDHHQQAASALFWHLAEAGVAIGAAVAVKATDWASIDAMLQGGVFIVTIFLGLARFWIAVREIIRGR